jgi:type IV pilus assembly protein PilQ
VKKKTVLAGLAAMAIAGTLSAGPARKPAHRSGTPPERVARERDPDARFTGERISLDLKDADLRDVVATFGKLLHINVAVDPEVRGSVTLRLHDVPWDQVLDVILRSNGWGYVLEGNIVRIGSPAKLADP